MHVFHGSTLLTGQAPSLVYAVTGVPVPVYWPPRGVRRAAREGLFRRQTQDTSSSDVPLCALSRRRFLRQGRFYADTISRENSAVKRRFARDSTKSSAPPLPALSQGIVRFAQSCKFYFVRLNERPPEAQKNVMKFIHCILDRLPVYCLM